MDMQMQVGAEKVLHVPNESGIKIKINTLLQEVLPGSTTLAEMEMISANVFGIVESWWKYGSVTKKQIPVPKGLPGELR